MTDKHNCGPPPDSDDSDCSCHEGFYFSEPLVREKMASRVQRDQALSEALKEGNLQRLREEIAAVKFDINAPVGGGPTLLMRACREGHYELAAHLVIHLGANVNMNVDSETPLMIACDCQTGDTDVAEKLVRLLLSHGAVINVSDKYGMTPFMLACRRGNINVVRLLINEFSFDAVDNQGCTPIFHAIEHNHGDICKLLVDAGFNATLANNKGYTPKQVAEFHGFYDLLELLPNETVVKYQVPSQFLSYNTLCDHVPRIFLKTDCPEYFQELSSILSSINMENMLEHFAKARISLAEFLNIDEQRLLEIGVQLPISRKRILKGILDFHLYHWTPKSIARVKRDGTDNFYDILLITANHLQHLVILQASLRYVMRNQLKGELGQLSIIKLAALQSNLKDYRCIIDDTYKTVKYLGSFSPHKSPLYIDYKEIMAERKRHKIRSVFKYTTIILGISVFIFLKYK